jgi:hypothetical protein
MHGMAGVAVNLATTCRETWVAPCDEVGQALGLVGEEVRDLAGGNEAGLTSGHQSTSAFVTKPTDVRSPKKWSATAIWGSPAAQDGSSMVPREWLSSAWIW